MMVGDDDEEYAFVCLCVTNNDLDLRSTTEYELHNRPGSQVLCKVELNPYTVKQRIYRIGCIEEIPVCSDDFADKFLLFSIL